MHRPRQNQHNATLLKSIFGVVVVVILFDLIKQTNHEAITPQKHPPPPPKEPQQGDFRLPYQDGLSEDRPVGWREASGLLSASLCLSDSSGSTPLLDPRFSPSSPPTVRSNRQGRGEWVDMLGAGSVFRLLVSNASTEAPPPHPPPANVHNTHTHTLTHTSHTSRKGRAIDGEAGAPAVTWRTPLDSWRLGERRRCQTCLTERGSAGGARLGEA